jgi:hypothetical protein
VFCPFVSILVRCDKTKEQKQTDGHPKCASRQAPTSPWLRLPASDLDVGKLPIRFSQHFVDS